jgi:hypothetical protein
MKPAAIPLRAVLTLDALVRDDAGGDGASATKTSPKTSASRAVYWMPLRGHSVLTEPA